LQTSPTLKTLHPPEWYSLDPAMLGGLRDESQSSQTYPAEQERGTRKFPVAEETEQVDIWYGKG